MEARPDGFVALELEQVRGGVSPVQPVTPVFAPGKEKPGKSFEQIVEELRKGR